MATTKKTAAAVIQPPKFQEERFKIIGIAPLVVHRFSKKIKEQMKQKMETGKAASSRKNREPKNTDDIYNEARYISKEGWDGFNASGVRNSLISMCRLVGFKMTLAKLSIFAIEDGWDALEPQIPLVRIFGEPVKQEDIGYTSTGEPYVTVRPAYHDWSASLHLRWDADQFTRDDVINLLMRSGLQGGLCEGRPDGKKSPGMGWGLFHVDGIDYSKFAVKGPE